MTMKDDCEALDRLYDTYLRVYPPGKQREAAHWPGCIGWPPTRTAPARETLRLYRVTRRRRRSIRACGNASMTLRSGSPDRTTSCCAWAAGSRRTALPCCVDHPPGAFSEQKL